MILLKIWSFDMLIGLVILIFLLISGGEIRNDLGRDWHENRVLAVKNAVIMAIILPFLWCILH